MTELSKLFPVVIATVQLAIILIVPVSQVVTAHRTSKETEKNPTLRVTEAEQKISEWIFKCEADVYDDMKALRVSKACLTAWMLDVQHI